MIAKNIHTQRYPIKGSILAIHYTWILERIEKNLNLGIITKERKREFIFFRQAIQFCLGVYPTQFVNSKNHLTFFNIGRKRKKIDNKTRILR